MGWQTSGSASRGERHDGLAGGHRPSLPGCHPGTTIELSEVAGPKGRLFTYRNLLLTMLLGGLWHGASWNFVIWGGLHGLAPYVTLS